MRAGLGLGNQLFELVSLIGIARDIRRVPIVDTMNSGLVKQLLSSTLFRYPLLLEQIQFRYPLLLDQTPIRSIQVDFFFVKKWHDLVRLILKLNLIKLSLSISKMV